MFLIPNTMQYINQSVACPANWTIFLLYCPVPYTLTMEDMSTLQDDSLLPIKLHHTNCTACLFAFHCKWLIVLLNLSLLHSDWLSWLPGLLANIDLIICLIGVYIRHRLKSFRISFFIHTAHTDTKTKKESYTKYG